SQLKATFPIFEEELRKLSDGRFRVERRSDTEAHVDVDEAALKNDLGGCQGVTVEVNIIQPLGGNRDEKQFPRTIFVSNKYHAGASGTPDADDSVLVLFLHEIGHALGMVPTAGHATFYDKRFGGVGNHCAFNAENLPQGAAHQRFGITPDVDPPGH